MNKKPTTYQELEAEEKRLALLLDAQKELILSDVSLVRENLQPISNSVGMISKMFSRDKGNLFANMGAQKLIDVVVKKVILGRAGWITRLAVPLLLKNYTSHVIADRKKDWVQKLFSWIGPRNHNGKAAPSTTVSEDHEPY
ncbi:MAG TPA: hypothetical protein VLJ68_14345 [Chitinophagaceae bacterium]|nr:hypothetical protein [Chitinophagaceae bacterium]